MTRVYKNLKGNLVVNDKEIENAKPFSNLGITEKVLCPKGLIKEGCECCGHNNVILAEVRALLRVEPTRDYRNIYVEGYNQAIDDVMDILSEHFS